MRYAFGWLFLLVLLAAAVLFVRDYIRTHPQDVPWTTLALDDPIGAFTSRKLAALRDSPEQCRALLRDAGAPLRAAPPVQAGPNCGYSDGVRLAPTSDGIGFRPGPPVTSCAVAASLLLFERQVVQAAARDHLGNDVTAIVHAGSYSCRRLYGRSDGPFSEHATANALDVTGFRLADGRQISVLRDWDAPNSEGRFLKQVRDGACDLFATVLSPDYNQAHADHLHLDQASRGRSTFTYCR